MLEFINSRLSIATRLALIATLFMVPVALLVYLFVNQSLGDISFAEKEIRGTRYLADLWPAYAKVAQAGTVNAGKIPVQPDYDAQFATADAGKAITEAKGLADTLAAAKALIGAVADGSNLTLDPDLDSFYAMDAATVRLPGIITAAVALGEAEAEPGSGPNRAVHIAFAVDRLQMSADDADGSLSAAIKNNASGQTGAALSARTAALKTAAQALSARGRALLDGLPATDLVAVKATLLREADATWTAANGELARLLRVRVDGLQRKMVMSMAVAGLFVLAAAALSLTIARGLSNRLVGLLAVMDRLVANDATVTIPFLGDGHETGRIAKTLAAFQESVRDRAKLKSEKAMADELAEERRRGEAARVASERKQTLVVDSVANGLERLAQGDLTMILSQPFSPEFEKIRIDLNTTVAALHDTILAISGGTNAIHSGTREIAAATADLARRTGQEAAILEESASALNTFAATLKRAADDASHVREAVSTTKAEAERSEIVVREAITAMSGIERSSKKINEIIGVMDEIAFQTNLLALNAGVEAARAGESGRGFAVVASEVRALAQRSAEAAKEIKGLIGESTKQVNQGAGLVMETGHALGRIVAQVGTMNAAMTDIASGATSQAATLQQINVAIGAMDKATQQNAEMVDKTTASAQALGHETAQLAALVGRFNVHAAPDARRARAA